MKQIIQDAEDIVKRWDQFNFDIQKRPQFVRHNREKWTALSTNHLHAVLKRFKIIADVLIEKDGSITLSIRDLGITTNGATKSEALDDLASFLVDYAESYYHDFQTHFYSPNRGEHFPYIVSVMIQEDFDGVRSLIKCQHT